MTPIGRPPLELTTRAPIAGLDSTDIGGAWSVPDMYLVFRDGESFYVSRPGAGSRVWVVPAGSVVSVAVGR